MYSQQEQRAFYDLSKAFLNPENKVHQQAVESRITDLRKALHYHEHRYYIQNDPVISDYEYDQLYKLLEAIEEQHPNLITPDSPTQRVSNDLTSDFASVEHLTPMLSLANSYNAEDLIDFDAQIKRYANLPEDEAIAYAIEPKYDGGSIALIYQGNQLVRAATRGNGTAGEEITNNARVIRSIPLKAEFEKYGIHQVELRGEVLIRKSRFNKINDERAASGLSLFANARNTATGGLRMKDPKEVERRGLEAFVYTLVYVADAEGNDLSTKFDTHEESLDMLTKLGFKVPSTEAKERIFRQRMVEVARVRKGFPSDQSLLLTQAESHHQGELILDRLPLQYNCYP